MRQLPKIIILSFALAISVLVTPAAYAQTDFSSQNIKYFKGDLPKDRTSFSHNIYVAKSERYLFVTHATWQFDSDRRTARNIRQLQRLAGIFNIPIIALSNDTIMDDFGRWAADFKNSEEFLSEARIDHKMYSYMGSHNIIFPNLKEITFAGGYLEYCLCESMRDVIAGLLYAPAAKNSLLKTVTFKIDPDAVYSEGWGTPIAGRSMTDGALLFRWFYRRLSDTQLMDFFSNIVFSGSEAGFCSRQNSKPDDITKGAITPMPKRSDVTILIFKGPKSIGTIGTGPLQIQFKISN